MRLHLPLALLLALLPRAATLCTDTRCGGTAKKCCEGSPHLQTTSVCVGGVECDGCCGWIDPSSTCTNVSAPHLFKWPPDEGPHLDFSGELWWYLAVLDVVDAATGEKRTLGLQLSFIRSTPVCGDAAWTNNSIVSDFAIADVGPRAAEQQFRFHHRIDPGGAANGHLAGTKMSATPYTLSMGPSLAGSWGIHEEALSFDRTKQVLDVETSEMHAHVVLDIASDDVLMADQGWGDACDAWYHVSKPRSAVRNGSWIVLPSGNWTVVAGAPPAPVEGRCTDTRCGGAAKMCCEGSPHLQKKNICTGSVDCDSCCGWKNPPPNPRANAVWLQHIWWSANGACEGRLPTWDWLFLQLDDGTNLAMVLFLERTEIVKGECRGVRNSYGNVISADGTQNVMLNVTEGELCVEARRPWTSNVSNLTYATEHVVTVKMPGPVTLTLVVATLLRDNEITFDGLPIAYYEGASLAVGTRKYANGTVVALRGRGYTEHQGYSYAPRT